MNVVNYLREVYGSGVPIILKDLRIGGKSNTAIRKELSRAVKDGKIERESHGIYFIKDDTSAWGSTITFEQIITKKFIKDDYGIPGLDMDIYGYYTKHVFENFLGISTQVAAIPVIVTNKTSCTRFFKVGNRKALIKKGKTEINRLNYKTLQIFDLFDDLTLDEVKEHKETLMKYIRENITKRDFKNYSYLASFRVLKIMTEEGFLNALTREF